MDKRIEMVSDLGCLIDAIERLGGKMAGKWKFHCWLGHEDNTPSGSVYRRKRKPAGYAWKCHSCDAGGDVLDLSPELALSKAAIKRPSSTVTETGTTPMIFKSEDELINFTVTNGEVLFGRFDYGPFSIIRIHSCRNEGKRFITVTKALDGFRFGISSPTPYPLYVRGEDKLNTGCVIVVEGERKVDLLAEQGFRAATSAFGAKSAQKTDWSSIKGSEIIVWPDLDQAGAGYAAEVARILQGMGCLLLRELTIEQLKELNLKEGEDVVDLHKRNPDFITKVKKLIEDSRGGIGTRVEIGNAETHDNSNGISKISNKNEVFNGLGLTAKEWKEAYSDPSITVLFGGPGTGKTNCVIQILHDWIRSGIKTCIIEGEMSYDQVSRRMDKSGFDKNDMGNVQYYNGSTIESPARLRYVLEEFYAKGATHFIIDSWSSLFDKNKPHSFGVDGSGMKLLQEFRELGCVFLIITHSSGANRNRDLITFEAVAGGSEISRMSDTVIFITSSHGGGDTGKKTYMVVIKNRTGNLLGRTVKFDTSDYLKWKIIGEGFLENQDPKHKFIAKNVK